MKRTEEPPVEVNQVLQEGDSKTPKLLCDDSNQCGPPPTNHLRGLRGGRKLRSPSVLQEENLSFLHNYRQGRSQCGFFTPVVDDETYFSSII